MFDKLRSENFLLIYLSNELIKLFITNTFYFLLPQARSQDFVMEGLILESGGESPSRRSEARGSKGGATSARRFLQFFNKNNAFLGIYA